MKKEKYEMTMIKKARDCDDCLCWLKYCDAECCKGFQCPTGPNTGATIEDGVFKIRVPMNPDKKWYFELHGVRVHDNTLNIPEERCEFLPRLVSVHMPCEFLTEDNLCIGHPDNKPEICKGLTLETIQQALPKDSDAAQEGYRLTPNCLFKYKK